MAPPEPALEPSRPPRLVCWVVLVAASLLSCSPGAEARDPELSPTARQLQAYLRIDTTNPPGGEAAAVTYLADILHRDGIETLRLVSPAGRQSLYARLDSGHREAGALVLMHHMDVVPAGPGWSVEPFGGGVADGRLWGRGALDIKSLGIAQLQAFLDLADAAREGAQLARDVVFLAVADEERGGIEGSQYLLEHHRGLLGPIHAVINEGGANRTVNGRNLWAGIEISQKRPLWLEVRATGRGGHGSGFNPQSAANRLVRGLGRLLERPPEFKVSEGVRLYLAALAPLHNDKYRPVFARIDDHIEPEGPTVSLLPGMENLFLDTVQVTVLEGSDKINVVPAEAVAQLDVRLLPETDADAYLAEVERLLGESVEVRVLVASPPSEPSPVDHPAYRAIAEVLGETAPAVPTFLSGFTDSRLFRERGIPAYGVSPFFLEPQDLLGIHGTDERIPLAELERGTERMRQIVRRIALAAPADDASD